VMGVGALCMGSECARVMIGVRSSCASSNQSRPLRLCVSYHCAAEQRNNRYNYDDASRGRCSRHLQFFVSVKKLSWMSASLNHAQ
jgi:hypothetical protein